MNMKENWQAINAPTITCDTCNDPTRYPFGFWDGENGTHGQLFDCHNLNCELKQAKLKAADYSEENRKAVIATNESNMIFVELIKAKRKELMITIVKMAKELSISCSDYSNYEMCREALPVEMVDRINGFFRRSI